MRFAYAIEGEIRDRMVVIGQLADSGAPGAIAQLDQLCGQTAATLGLDQTMGLDRDRLKGPTPCAT